MNKLDYLAQKEEELRKLNEQLEQRKQNILEDQHSLNDSLEEDKKADSNPFFDKDEEDQDGEGGLQDAGPSGSQSSTRLLKEAQQLRQSYSNNRQQQDEEFSPQFDQALADVNRYRQLLDKSKEQEKVISF
jgi:DNA-binding protein H-NS